MYITTVHKWLNTQSSDNLATTMGQIKTVVDEKLEAYLPLLKRIYKKVKKNNNYPPLIPSVTVDTIAQFSNWEFGTVLLMFNDVLGQDPKDLAKRRNRAKKVLARAMLLDVMLRNVLVIINSNMDELAMVTHWGVLRLAMQTPEGYTSINDCWKGLWCAEGETQPWKAIVKLYKNIKRHWQSEDMVESIPECAQLHSAMVQSMYSHHFVDGTSELHDVEDKAKAVLEASTISNFELSVFREGWQNYPPPEPRLDVWSLKQAVDGKVPSTKFKVDKYYQDLHKKDYPTDFASLPFSFIKDLGNAERVEYWKDNGLTSQQINVILECMLICVQELPGSDLPLALFLGYVREDPVDSYKLIKTELSALPPADLLVIRKRQSGLRAGATTVACAAYRSVVSHQSHGFGMGQLEVLLRMIQKNSPNIKGEALATELTKYGYCYSLDSALPSLNRGTRTEIVDLSTNEQLEISLNKIPVVHFACAYNWNVPELNKTLKSYKALIPNMLTMIFINEYSHKRAAVGTEGKVKLPFAINQSVIRLRNNAVHTQLRLRKKELRPDLLATNGYNDELPVEWHRWNTIMNTILGVPPKHIMTVEAPTFQVNRILPSNQEDPWTLPISRSHAVRLEDKEQTELQTFFDNSIPEYFWVFEGLTTVSMSWLF